MYYKGKLIALLVCTIISVFLMSLVRKTKNIETFDNLEPMHKDIIHRIKNKTLKEEDLKHYIKENMINQKDIDIIVAHLQ